MKGRKGWREGRNEGREGMKGGKKAPQEEIKKKKTYGKNGIEGKKYSKHGK